MLQAIVLSSYVIEHSQKVETMPERGKHLPGNSYFLVTFGMAKFSYCSWGLVETWFRGSFNIPTPTPDDQ